MIAGIFIHLNDEPLYIGASQFYGDKNFDGRLDEIRIYDHALSPDQVLALYDSSGFMLAAAETASGEVWQTFVTPFS